METDSDPIDLSRLTTDIVTAYLEYNKLPPSELAPLIRSVAESLRALEPNRAAVSPEKPTPAVPIRRSVQPDRLICLVCGRSQKTLKRHLTVAHGLDPAAYRAMFELKPDYPMAAPNYSEQRSTLARQIGFGTSPRKQPGRKRHALTA